jgi:ferredoxin
VIRLQPFVICCNFNRFPLAELGMPIAHSRTGGFFPMAYVIVDSCTKDENCIEACPIDCIHPRKDEAKFAEVPQLFINPDECTDCGACVPACDFNSIYPLDDLPENLKGFAEKNAAYYR